MSQFELIATSAFGLEAVVAREIRELGYEKSIVENGKVTFTADASGIPRTNMWLRAADRVLLKVGEFKAVTFEDLFQGTRELPWPEWLPEDALFPVEGKSIDSALHSVPDCQAVVKKAVVEKMKQKYHREWFDETGPRYRIEVALHKDRATLTIDTSGAGLHKRGYRKQAGEAPIKETLAAAMVLLSRWDSSRPLADPFCGSGTILVEAAMIGRRMAPGLGREFDAEKWPVLDRVMWKRTREEARQRALPGLPLKLQGFDADEGVLALARNHAREAGVKDGLTFVNKPLREFNPEGDYGCLVTNPPYGIRSGDIAGAELLYREMGRVTRKLNTWSFFILTSHQGFERFFGRPASRKRKLYNGRIQCGYYQYFGPWPSR